MTTQQFVERGKKSLGKIVKGWTFWLSLSFILFWAGFILPLPPGTSILIGILVLVVGRIFFVTKPLKLKNILVASLASIIFLLGFVILSFVEVAKIPFLKLLVVAVIIDLINIPTFHFIGIGRLLGGGGRIASSVLQRFIPALISSLIVVWAFGSSGVFLIPFVIFADTIRFGLFPITTLVVMGIKILGLILGG